LLLALFAASSGARPAEGADDPSPWPDAIEVLGRYDGPAFAELLEVRTWGDRVAFCSGVQGLNLYDAADPADMRLLDRTGFSRGNRMLPRCQHVVVDEGSHRLYVSHHGDMIQRRSFLAVIDASNPRRLREIGLVEREESVEGLALHGDLLLVAAHGAGLLVFRRGAGGELTEVGRAGGLGNAWAVAAAGDHAYLTDNGGALFTLDLSRPDAPEVVGRLELPGSPRDIEIEPDAGRGYVALGSAGIARLDLGDPRSPRLLEVLDTPGTAVDVASGSGTLFVADWTDVRAIDLRDPDRMAAGAREPLPAEPGLEVRTLGVAVRGSTVFSAGWRGLIAYRHHPDRSAPDLVVSPPDLHPSSVTDGAPVEAFATLTNEGRQTLRLLGVLGAPGITADPLPDSLAPGDRATLRVEIEGNRRRPLTGQVEILSDDPDQPRLALRVRARGAGTGVGDPWPQRTLADRSGTQVAVGGASDGPTLLAYFATF